MVDEISTAIQFGDAAPQIAQASTTTPGYVCIGPNRYTIFKLNTQVQGANHALGFDKNGLSCTANTAFRGAKELLGDNMRLTKFSVTPRPSAVSPSYYDIEVNIIYGTDDLFTGDNCNGGKGSQFCASAHLTTTVFRRKT
ncbi:MAG: hypothetical protein NTX11_01595 [Candidatus Saccharibacteria bacterium]|nr:hypothetical protein [Candidatus Saccharibacteria bacterium]